MTTRVLHVASELAPFAMSGGLADVLAGLPAALAESHGLPTAIVVPMYRGVRARLAAANIAVDDGLAIELALGPHRFAASVRTSTIGRVRVGWVDCPPLYDRDGTLYGPSGTAELPVNHLRFGALGKAALIAGPELLGGRFDVLHVLDWQGSAAAIYARYFSEGRPPTIIQTVHNLAYRGIYPKAAIADLGFPWDAFTPDKLEFWDQLCLLKGGMAVADAVTTVSPSYAREIITSERGEALDGFLRWDVRRLVGIVNGIDVRAWDPAVDPVLAAPFSATDPRNKARCREALGGEMGLRVDDGAPLIGVVARMTDQKGLDLVAEIAPELHRLGARMVVLGSGDPALESRFRYLADTFRDHVAVRIGFDLDLARRIYAGSDLFVMPSRFEPCGLGQLYAMRYGAIPVVHAVGGLRDTVLDPGDDDLARGRGTGIRFDAATPAFLLRALERGIALYRRPAAWTALQRAAMQRDSSWTASAQLYLQLYRSLAPSR
ncbi:MAG: glycogen synthase GlgA [Proteobacteria bacterium]|nr:glycogen synthase GlgA [Pseudomonadota bacterium]